MKSQVSEVTPLQFEHGNGCLSMTLTQQTQNGFDIRESTFRLIVPYREVPDVLEKMLTTPDIDMDELRSSESIQKLSRSDMSAPDMIEKAFELIVAANFKSRAERSLKEKDRLIKIACAFHGMTSEEWDALDEVTKDSSIANALRAQEVMAE